MSVLGSTLGNFIIGGGGGRGVCVLLSPEVICNNNYNECDISLTTKETVKSRGSVNVLGADK